MKELSRIQMKQILGGDDCGGTSCSADCPVGKEAKITNCNGTCTGYVGYAECVGENNTLKKNCATTP